MQKFSNQVTTFIDHRRKGESLWYHPNFEPILDRFAGFVFIPLCECNFSPTGLLERTGAYQYKIALIAV